MLSEVLQQFLHCQTNKLNNYFAPIHKVVTDVISGSSIRPSAVALQRPKSANFIEDDQDSDLDTACMGLALSALLNEHLGFMQLNFSH